MGQYYLICNVDKQEYLYPHKFGQGLKLREFGGAADSLGYALITLLADGNGRGGGDLFPYKGDPDPLIGSWAGDRIVVAGDYADPKYIPLDSEGNYKHNLYDYANESYKDISDDIIRVLRSHDQYCELNLLDMESDGWRQFKPSPEGNNPRTHMYADTIIYASPPPPRTDTLVTPSHPEYKNVDYTKMGKGIDEPTG